MNNQVRTSKKSLLLMSIVAVVSLTAVPAHAYIDPGTGSLVIQSIIGALAAIGVTLKLYWHKIRLLFSSSQKNSESSSEEQVTKD